MKLVIYGLLAALLYLVSFIADTPILETVANCSTDSECENGPDLENPFKE